MTTVEERTVASSPRLFAGIGEETLSLAEHLAVHGSLPVGIDAGRLRREITASGLLGRGGAGFPVGQKLDATAAEPGPRVVVGNGAESEPSSRKDLVLLDRTPHLVLDGLAMAARAVGAEEIHLVLHRGSPALAAVRTALTERPDLAVELHELPRRYVASEASALVQWLSGGDAKPTFGRRAAVQGVHGRPTYVGNVESLAAVGLIARHGAQAWRAVGDPAEPGTLLVSVTTPGDQPRVIEVPTGTSIRSVLLGAGTDPLDTAGVVVGGWGGSWLTPAEAAVTGLSHRALAGHGGLGCASVVALPLTCCPLVEVAAVAGWLTGQSAAQCGPCLHGLPAIAGALQRLAAGHPAATDEAALARWARVVPRRGARAHPDGAVTFVASALRVFAAHAATHRSRGACHAAARPATLATPRTEEEWR